MILKGKLSEEALSCNVSLGLKITSYREVTENTLSVYTTDPITFNV